MNFFLQFTDEVEGIPSTCFYWKKIGKKMRLIGDPNKPMRKVQTRIVNYLRNFAPSLPSATACKYGMGAVRNGRTHTQSDFIFKLDFSDAFENVDGKALSEIIAKRVAKYSPRDADTPTSEEWFSFLSLYALRKDGALIRGAKTSGLLFDWYCEVMVNQSIRKLLYESEVVFTQYVDDLVFTAKRQDEGTPNPITRNLRKRIRHIISTAGFVESPSKTVVAEFDVHGAVTVTGVNIGANGHIGIGRKNVKKLERMLVYAIEMPLFAVNPNVIKGKVNYLLDVLRGKQELNQLERLTLLKYVEWCRINGIDSRWAKNTLKNKSPKTVSKQQKRKSKSKPK